MVDYDSENLKAGAAFHFRLKPEKTLESTELLLATNYSTGTTVYQGDNRFSLRDIQFFQHRIELRNRDDFLFGPMPPTRMPATATTRTSLPYAFRI